MSVSVSLSVILQQEYKADELSCDSIVTLLGSAVENLWEQWVTLESELD